MNRLKALGKVEILEILHEAVQPKNRSRGKKHEVWMDAFDIKECRTEKFLLQKLNWNLATEPHLYRHSSALQYMNEKISMYSVKDYLEFIEMYYHSE